MNLFGSTKNKITKDGNGENVSHFDITEVLLVSTRFKSLIYIFPNKLFDQFLDISPKTFIFLKTFDQNFHILKYGLLI